MRAKPPRLCVVESPYKAFDEFTLQRNLAYARALLEHVTLRGDAPNASHLSLTQALDDRNPEHREAGIVAGLAWLRVSDIHVFGTDVGWSDGMQRARKMTPARCAYEELSLPEWKDAMTCNGTAPLEALIDRYRPKWHVHESAQSSV